MQTLCNLSAMCTGDPRMPCAPEPLMTSRTAQQSAHEDTQAAGEVHGRSSADALRIVTLRRSRLDAAVHPVVRRHEDYGSHIRLTYKLVRVGASLLCHCRRLKPASIWYRKLGAKYGNAQASDLAENWTTILHVLQ
jgi:hypothetical protein